MTDLGLQRGGGRVEVHDRPAVDRARQQREVLAQRLDVERCRRRAGGGRGGPSSPRLVALGLDLRGQLGAAAGDDAPVDEDVHDVGHELFEQALRSG